MINKNVQLTKPKVIYFDAKVAESLERLAHENAVSLNALVKMACREWLQKNVYKLSLSAEPSILGKTEGQGQKQAGKDELSIRFAEDD